MSIEYAKVDYSKLVPVYKNRALVNVKGWRYLPYIREILALRGLGLKYRSIAEWLNSEVRAEVVLTNSTLSAYVLHWKKTKLLDEIKKEDIEETAKKIRKAMRESSGINSWSPVPVPAPVPAVEPAQSVAPVEEKIEEKVEEEDNKPKFSYENFASDYAGFIGRDLNENEIKIAKELYSKADKNSLTSILIQEAMLVAM